MPLRNPGYSILFFAVLTMFAGSCKRDPLVKLPIFDIRLSDSTTIFNTKNIPGDKPIIMMHFDADCHDCQLETDSLLKNMDVLKDVRIYMFTIGEFRQVSIFREYYKLNNYPNIVIGQDEKGEFAHHFGSGATPFTALYDKNRRLIGAYEGRADIHHLINTVNKLYQTASK